MPSPFWNCVNDNLAPVTGVAIGRLRGAVNGRAGIVEHGKRTEAINGMWRLSGNVEHNIVCARGEIAEGHGLPQGTGASVTHRSDCEGRCTGEMEQAKRKQEKCNCSFHV